MFKKILCRRRPRISTLGAALGRTQKSIGQKTPHGGVVSSATANRNAPTRPRHDAPPVHLGLSNGVNIKWLAEYCGTSVAITEKHYAKYIRDDVDKQLARTLDGKSEPLEVHSGKERGGNCGKV